LGNPFKTFVRRNQEKRYFVRSGRRWEVNIKIYIRKTECEYMDCIQEVYVRVQRGLLRTQY
jgi:hypothetical protein